MKFFSFFSKTSPAKDTSSEFSRFFRDASSREKKKVFLDVARKASADQLRVIREVKGMPSK